jgi:four helix bundle protein
VATIRRIEDIKAWQQARELVRETYRICREGPLKNDLGLRDQMCRAAVSSMSNAAEGFARKSDRDFARFVDVAKASAIEVQSSLYVALEVGYISRDEFHKLHRMAEETVLLLGGLASYLRTSLRSETPRSGLKRSGPTDSRLSDSGPKDP